MFFSCDLFLIRSLATSKPCVFVFSSVVSFCLFEGKIMILILINFALWTIFSNAPKWLHFETLIVIACKLFLFLSNTLLTSRFEFHRKNPRMSLLIWSHCFKQFWNTTQSQINQTSLKCLSSHVTNRIDSNAFTVFEISVMSGLHA